VNAASCIVPVMTTGGRGLDEARACALAQAGLARASVSIDGLAPTHDLLRGSPGSFVAAIAALRHLRAAGVEITANTNLNRANRSELEALYDVLRDEGIRAWQVQLTAPLGRAADRPELLLQPWDLLDVVPRVAALKQRARTHGIVIMPGNNLGYFGPEEARLRSLDDGAADHFAGCQAGRFVLGIESDGALKGCPSLQTDAYVVGNVRAHGLANTWQGDAIRRPSARTQGDLWGFCARCPFAAVCRGGCTFTAHAIMGRPGNNPYCHFRARTLAAEGVRERLVPVERAPGRPFDNGRFDIVVEPIDAADPGRDRSARERLRIV
jgi:radical SAM protein with 4Fe4S-binding SPASM domain